MVGIPSEQNPENLRRAVVQMNRRVEIQRIRVIVSAIFLFCAGVGGAVFSMLDLLLLLMVCLIAIPFCLLAVIADFWLLLKYQARLAEYKQVVANPLSDSHS